MGSFMVTTNRSRVVDDDDVVMATDDTDKRARGRSRDAREFGVERWGAPRSDVDGRDELDELDER